MKKQARLALAFLCYVLPFYCLAQTINVKSADGATDIVYTNPNDLQTAITNASAGSTITLSGGVFNTANAAINISKEIHIVGAGYVADSTTQTGRTLINGSVINLKSGSDNTTLEGFEFIYSIQIAEYPATKVKNILINKVKVNSVTCGCNGGTCSPSNSIVSNIIVSNSVLSTISLGYATQVRIYNNIIIGSIYQLNGTSEISNNIFFNSLGGLSDIYFTVIKNNIFNSSVYVFNSFYGRYLYSDNIESNNFLSTNTWPSNSNGSTSINNIPNGVLTDIFQTYSSTNATFDKAYLLDLHIKTGSVAKGKGTDGKDLGIYGGDGYRTKPSIPFIELKEVAKQTNAQGQLPVNIRVKAQGNN